MANNLYNGDEEEILVLVDEDGNEIVEENAPQEEFILIDENSDLEEPVYEEFIDEPEYAEPVYEEEIPASEEPVDLAMTQVIGAITLDDEYELEEPAFEPELEDIEDDEFEEEEDGFFAGTTGKLLALFGAVILVIAIAVLGITLATKTAPKTEAVDFSTLGSQIASLGLIGGDNIDAIAVAEGERLDELYEAKKNYNYNEADQENGISSISINLTSILKDLKIKVVNSKGKLIGNVPFEVEVTTPGGKTEIWTDDDKDGIIYKTDLAGGTYKAKVVALNGYDSMYDFSTCKSQSLAVKTQLDYQKVDVKNEIKDSSQVSKTEDAAAKETEVESKLKDTVGYVMSSKTASSNGYEPIGKDKITDPFKTLEKKYTAALSKFMRLSAVNAKPPVPTEDEGDGSSTETPETPEPHTHSFAWESNNNGTHTGTCACGGEGSQITQSCDCAEGAACSVCGYVRPVTTPTHTHNYDEATWKTDASNHWHECVATEGTCDAKQKDKAVHDFVLKAGSQGTTTTKKHKDVCSVCGYEKEVECTPGDDGKCSKCGGTVKVNTEATIKGFSGTAKDKKLSLTDVNRKTGTLKVDYEINPPAKTVTFAWSTPNNDIVSIGNGDKQEATLTALKQGKATITCTITYTDEAGNTATVSQPTIQIEVESTTIQLDKSGKQIVFVAGDQVPKLEVKATLAGAKGNTEENIIWAIKDTSIATIASKVDAKDEGENRVSSCVVTGVKAGTTTLVCQSTSSASVYQELTIVVVDNPRADSVTKLVDNNGKQVYKYDSASKKYVEATYSDYFTGVDLFTPVDVSYTYNGWWTIDGKTYYFDANGKKVTGDQVILGAKYSFDANGVLKSGTGQFGIDVSTWNGNIDWSKVAKSGVSYAIIRCGFRGTTIGGLIEDNKFESNIKNATAAGIKVGVYFFTQAISEAEAVEEASMCLALCEGKKLTYPIFIDVESAKDGRANNLSKEARTAIVKAFCKTITNGGRKAGVYANKSWFTNYLNVSELTGYTIWLAQYISSPTYTASRYDLWQYSNQGTISGISGNVDLNLNYLGY